MGRVQEGFTIDRLTKSDPRVLAEVNRLTPQLKPTWKNVTSEMLETVLQSPTRMYVARADNVIVGMLLLVPHRHLPGLRFHVEDVVVDEGHRRRGIARALLARAMKDAPDETISFDLRSHQVRRAAHSLYEEMGFEPSDTTVFRRLADPGLS